MKKTLQEPRFSKLTPRELQMNDDYDWAWNDAEIKRLYGGRVVVVHKRKIWGSGANHATAWANAQRKKGCPLRMDVAIVPVPKLTPWDPADRAE
jgi:hypothetical protein